MSGNNIQRADMVPVDANSRFGRRTHSPVMDATLR